MSENKSEEENSLFRDYKSENFDDNDLQSQLYAEIYYESNIEDEPKASNTSRIQFTNMVAELNTEPEGMQQKEDEQSLEFVATRDKSNKAKKISKEHCIQNTPLSNKSSIIEPLMSNDTLQTQNDDPRSVETQTNTDKLSDREINPVIHEHDNNDNPGNLSMEKGKKCKESGAKKHKSSNHTKNKHQEKSSNNYTASSNDKIYLKCNVVLKRMKKEALDKQLKKDEQTSDSSDSEESIFEVPVPPKPKPPLINLQDSDEENDTNSRMNNPILEKIPAASYKITGESSSHQNTSFKNKNTDKSLHNKNTTVNSASTSMQEIREDIVLNCTIVQKGAKSISEIKQSSKNAELNKNQKKVSTEDTNQNSAKQLSRNTSKENNFQQNFQQKIFVTPERYLLTTQQNNDENNTHNIYNLRSVSKNNTLNAKASCSNSDIVINRKRQHNENENSKEKRQCIVQENNQDVMQQSSSEERRNESKNEYFKSMPNSMRNYYYNSSRDLENFDVSELQQRMSRDPRIWKIIDEDLMPSPPSRQRTRFWNVRCSNCHRDGHQRYDCPIPRRIPCCYICGEKGHIESRCPQKICFTCGKQQNTFRQTCEYCRVLYCTMCHSVGHESTQCPDLWRRYHQTTDMSNVPQNPRNVMKPSGLLHCCNCTKRGHESSMCKEYKWSLHFQTPAEVTNYIDGPMYMDGPYAMNFSDFEMDTLSSATSSRSIPDSPKNIQQITEEHPKSAVDTISSSAKANETPISQGTLCNSEVEKNLESSSKVDEIFRPEEKQKKHKQNVINNDEFTTILFSFGKFHSKNDKNARIITRKLSLLKSNLSCYGRTTIINSLPKRKVVPNFLQTLTAKAIEFEVRAGFTSASHQAIVLKIIAMNEYIELIYDLLLYWLNLPDNEKSYGVDVTLPMSPTKMFNLLSSRLPQLTKMSFTSYDKHVGGPNDPRILFNLIKQFKKQLEQHKGTRKQHIRLRTRMCRVQVKLLMIVNTEPKQNIHILQFHNAMKQLESKKQNLEMEQLDIATYLKLTLLYNHLFVPHTPDAVHQTLDRIKKHEEEMAKNTNYSSQMPQKLGKNKIYEQENLESYVDVNTSTSSAISCISPDINSAENPSTINVQQSTSNETFEHRGVVDSIIDEIIDSDDNEVMIIEDSVAQNCQNITVLNTETFNNDKSVLIPVEDQIEDQLNDLNVEKAKKLVSKLTQQEKNKKKQLLQKQLIKKKKKKKNIYREASLVIKEARTLNLMDAAKQLQRKIGNQTIQPKHVSSLKDLINLEKKYHKKHNIYWKNLNT